MEAWGVIGTVLTLFLTLLAALLRKRYKGALKTGKALGGLSVAFGLGLINASRALEDQDLTQEERAQVARDIKVVGYEARRLAKYATELWRGGS